MAITLRATKGSPLTHDEVDDNFTSFQSTSNGEGAALVGIEDAGGYYTGTTVEEALQQLGAAGVSGGVINSIQRGTISITGSNLTATATITAVDTSKTEVRWLGHTVSASVQAELGVRLSLTNSTTITATRAIAPGSPTTIVSFEVTEWA